MVRRLRSRLLVAGPSSTACSILLFKAIGEPTRAKLLACLVKCGRPCSVTEVAECCSIDFSMVARHLAALARAGLLEARKEGRSVWYQARAAELSAQFHELGDAITEWSAVDGCDSESSSGSGGCRK